MGCTTMILNLTVVLLGAIAAFYVGGTGTIDLWYRATTSVKAFAKIITMPKKDIEAFVNSYEIFGKEVITAEDESKIADYYRVINQLCALGETEKMYIPALYDINQGVYGNQLMFEREMAKTLDVKEGDRLLELGCGRGRISNHVARLTGASVTGMNIESSQVENAKQYAEETGLSSRLEFVQGSFNDPLPFKNQSFDGFYHVQALTYVSDLDNLFGELYRVLKPGSKLSFFDWFKLDAYDETNPRHRDLMEKTKAIIGGVRTPHPNEYIQGLEKAGFVVHFSKEASKDGQRQGKLIEKARDFFMPVGTFVNFLTDMGVIGNSTAILLNRLNLYVNDFIEGDQLELFTTSWWIVAQKPPVGPRGEKIDGANGINADAEPAAGRAGVAAASLL